MIRQNLLEQALNDSLHWFQDSTVMVPSNGFWGIAERIFDVPDPELRKKVFNTFNSFTDYGSWSVIESRRPDCNFQTAYLFLLASQLDLFKDSREKLLETARNLLDFLYFRSGLLNRGVSERAPLGTWNWSHTQWQTKLWFDDNAWTLAIPLLILKQFPKEAERLEIKFWAEKLAGSLSDGFTRTFHCGECFLNQDCYDPAGLWMGRPLLPHWGGLVCFALSLAHSAGIGKKSDEQLIHEYLCYVRSAIDSLNVSELAYALIGTSAAAALLPESRDLHRELATVLADRILQRMDPESGNVPAEHYEAPKGSHLVDTIYTVNWVLLGLQNFLALHPDPRFRAAYEKLLSLVLRIQDHSRLKPYHGCWRGMFDLKSGTWGGGNAYEGGSGSIYSGWTNAPIAILIALELQKASILQISAE